MEQQTRAEIRPLLALACATLFLLVCVCQAGDLPKLLTPKAYSDLHIVAVNPKDPKWADSIRRLATEGDGYTLECFKTLDAKKLTPAQTELLAAASLSIRKRVGEEDLQTFTRLIQLRLERAAWADLSCNPLEGTLVPWTLGLIRQRTDAPEVMAELRGIELHYVPSVQLTTLFSTLQERVPTYVRQILAATSKAGGNNRKLSD